MGDRESAKKEINGLLEKYARVVEEKRVQKYNEEMTKKDFILPLFRALEWNVEDSEEVTAEEKISKKRVDYGFRIKGIPKFFLEAKSLKEDLNNPEFIAQAINYAWYKGCTWAVLTDFESVKIFNAEVKTANPLQSNLKTIYCHEFLNRFNELWLLSRESFEQGLLDKEAEKWGKKTKKTPVDKQLLSDFTRFRELLSKNVTKLNQSKNLTEEDLDEAIQRLLDRLIFIRNCEDREIEAKVLISNLREWESKGKGQLIKELRNIFKYFDKTYDSKIFRIHLSDDLTIDNEVLHEIIEGLYYTKDQAVSYDFSAIEADVLGNIYEQYLGHILKKTEKRAKLERDSSHRKEQGIYYTPTYIVDYIVKNTVGEVLKDKKIDAEKIRVLDPACGSGSFLIKTFDVLNRFYNKKKNYNQTQLDGSGRGITYSTKLKILKNNIFGVDLDKQAIEVAELNLLLKVAEKGQMLPLLQENIKCGNSLIEDNKIAGDKAFKWEENFSGIIKEGGFDVVIGNPPYVSATMLNEKDKSYFINNYISAKGRLDTYGLFIEKALIICKYDGFVGFIIPNKFLTNVYFGELRRQILKVAEIISITSLKSIVFESAAVNNIIILLRKRKSPNQNNLVKIIDLFPNIENNITKIRQSKYLENQNSFFTLEGSEQFDKITEKISATSKNLGDISDVRDGIVAGRCKDILFHNKMVNQGCKKIIFGDDMNRYTLRWKGRYVDYRPEYMKKQEEIRVKGKGLGIRLRVPEIFETEKILTRKTADRIIGCYDSEGYYFEQTVHGTIIRDSSFNIKYVLGIINSKLYEFYYKKIVHQVGTIFPQVRIDFLKKLPIKDATEFQQKQIIRIVDKTLSLNKRLNEIKDKQTDEKTRLEKEIQKTDDEIDQEVYKIYGITKEEQKIIEESLK